MVFFNYATMQMAAKIVYYGPGLCGKTTNLHYIYTKTSPQSRGEMVSLETETDRTLFFDLLPIDVGVIGGFKTRLQLYTVPGQVFYNTTRKLVLKGVDGIVFVADSQRPMLDANAESFKNLRENLEEIGLSLDDLPLVIQLNKRDLPNAAPREMILKHLDGERQFEAVEAIASGGSGVFETLKLISKLTLRTLRRRMTSDEPIRPVVPPRRPTESRPLRAADPAAAKRSAPGLAPVVPPILGASAPSPKTAAALATSTQADADIELDERPIAEAMRSADEAVPAAPAVPATAPAIGEETVDFRAKRAPEPQEEEDEPQPEPASEEPPQAAQEAPFEEPAEIGGSSAAPFLPEEHPATAAQMEPATAAALAESAAEPLPEVTTHEAQPAHETPHEPEIDFNQSARPARSAAVKHVKVRSSVDIMAELEALRKRATQSAPRARKEAASEPAAAATRDVKRTVTMKAVPDARAKTRSVRITVSFEGDGGVLQTEEQSIEVAEVSEVRSLSVDLKIALE